MSGRPSSARVGWPQPPLPCSFCPDSQALEDCLVNVGQNFLVSQALAHASRDRRALGNNRSVFVSLFIFF